MLPLLPTVKAGVPQLLSPPGGAVLHVLRLLQPSGGGGACAAPGGAGPPAAPPAKPPRNTVAAPLPLTSAAVGLLGLLQSPPCEDSAATRSTGLYERRRRKLPPGVPSPGTVGAGEPQSGIDPTTGEPAASLGN